jgi:hypothetical protein
MAGSWLGTVEGCIVRRRRDGGVGLGGGGAGRSVGARHAKHFAGGSGQAAGRGKLGLSDLQDQDLRRRRKKALAI